MAALQASAAQQTITATVLHSLVAESALSPAFSVLAAALRIRSTVDGGNYAHKTIIGRFVTTTTTTTKKKVYFVGFVRSCYHKVKTIILIMLFKK